MRSAAFEGGGFVLLEFEAGFNSDVALQDVRAKVDDAKRDLPADADEPGVYEVNLSLFPILVVTLSGDISERSLGEFARETENGRSSRCPACCRPTSRARATKSSRSSPSRCS